jgi:solute carrier family 25 carnitine/acylcarnitine transporter 20/29
VKTVQQEGVLALYKGLSAPLAAQALYKAVIFASNQFAKQTFPSTSLPLLDQFISAGFGGAVNSAVVTPIELIRNRLIVQRGKRVKHSGPRDVVRNVIHSEGVLGLWKGLGPTLLRDVPGVGMWLTAFEMAKAKMKEIRGVSLLEFPDLLLCGSLGGIAFWSVALPVDTIKSVVQVSEKKMNMIQATRQIVSQHGIGFLFRAWPVAFGRGIPGAAVTLSTFDVVSRYLQKNGF